MASASTSTTADTTHPDERAGHSWEARHFGIPASGWRRRWFIVIFENDTRAGRLFDVGFRANRRNVAILKEHFEREGLL